MYKLPLNIQNCRKIPYRWLFQRLPKPPLNDLATPKTTTLENRRNKQIAAVQNRRRLPKSTAADLPFPCSDTKSIQLPISTASNQGPILIGGRVLK
ncbi:hypothetical protein QL285_091761 [Trifolium repens]|nr:hypothetical protein QL285_091761 [Trifolium repens]